MLRTMEEEQRAAEPTITWPRPPSLTGVGAEPYAVRGQHHLYIGGDAEQRYPGLITDPRRPERSDLDSLLEAFRQANAPVLGYHRIGQLGNRSWLFRVMAR